MNPLFLATAVEAVIKAGGIQMAFVESGFNVSKKGTIDLVTEADVAVENMFRAMIAERFPDHTILAEEFGQDAATREQSHCWVFDPIDGTNNYAHGLPIFCSSLALEVDGRAVLGAIYDPTRNELFVAEHGGGAFLNGEPIHVSEAATLVESMLVTGFPYDVHKRIPEIIGLFGEFVGRARAVRLLQPRPDVFERPRRGEGCGARGAVLPHRLRRQQRHRLRQPRPRPPGGAARARERPPGAGRE